MLFRNRTPHSLQAVQASILPISKQIKILLYILIAVMVTVGSLIYPKNKVLSVLITLLPLLAMLYYYYMVSNRATGQYKKMMNKSGHEPIAIMSFFEDHFEHQFEYSAQTTHFSYSDIQQFKQQGEFYVLVTKQAVLPMDRNRFIDGDSLDFLDFIEQKMQGAKR